VSDRSVFLDALSLVSERRTALSPDNVDNILFLHKIGLNKSYRFP